MGVLLQDWFNENMPEEDLIYGKGMKGQVIWVRDSLAWMIYRSLAENHPEPEKGWRSIVSVSSTHRSKSVVLPVYRFCCADTVIKIRGNFHDWCVRYSGPKVAEFPTWMRVYESTGFYEGMEGDHSDIKFCVGSREEMYAVIWWMLNNTEAA